jgi:hypothetical protein
VRFLGLFGDLAVVLFNQSFEHRQMTETLEITGKKKEPPAFAGGSLSAEERT